MNNNISEPIECPFCGKKTVLAKVATTYYFVAEHAMYIDGVDVDGDTMGEILGKMTCPPVMKYAGFRCTSCGKDWSKYEYAPVKDENGVISFVKQDKKKQYRQTDKPYLKCLYTLNILTNGSRY